MTHDAKHTPDSDMLKFLQRRNAYGLRIRKLFTNDDSGSRQIFHFGTVIARSTRRGVRGFKVRFDDGEFMFFRPMELLVEFNNWCVHDQHRHGQRGDGPSAATAARSSSSAQPSKQQRSGGISSHGGHAGGQSRHQRHSDIPSADASAHQYGGVSKSYIDSDSEYTLDDEAVCASGCN